MTLKIGDSLVFAMVGSIHWHAPMFVLPDQRGIRSRAAGLPHPS